MQLASSSIKSFSVFSRRKTTTKILDRACVTTSKTKSAIFHTSSRLYPKMNSLSKHSTGHGYTSPRPRLFGASCTRPYDSREPPLSPDPVIDIDSSIVREILKGSKKNQRKGKQPACRLSVFWNRFKKCVYFCGERKIITRIW